MIAVPEITIERIAVVEGRGEALRDLALMAAESAGRRFAADFGGVIVATFSGERRFPSLAVEIASVIGVPSSAPAFDIQMACGAYPYALYLAGRIAADTGAKVLVVDGDVQSRLVDAADHDTGTIFSDAATATVVSAGAASSPLEGCEPPSGSSALAASAMLSYFAFYNRFNDESLSCGESGPIRMKGFDVFSFVATEVSRFLRDFLSGLKAGSSDPDFTYFVPHQANPYMIRQLAKSLDLSGRLLTLDEAKKNPGSCSIPMTLAAHPECGGKRVLLAGFGAGYSAAAAVVRLGSAFAD